jgi:hypothetical protein
MVSLYLDLKRRYMTVISSNEFVANQNKYFDMAIDEDVCVKRGKNMFHIRYTPVKKTNEFVYFEPDEDFYNSLTMEDVREKLHLVIDKLYAK